jgi:hypothetical protein
MKERSVKEDLLCKGVDAQSTAPGVNQQAHYPYATHKHEEI